MTIEVKNKSHVGACDIHAYTESAVVRRTFLYVLLKTRAGFISMHGL